MRKCCATNSHAARFVRALTLWWGCSHAATAHGPPPKPSSPASLFPWHLDSDLLPKPFEGHRLILDVQSLHLPSETPGPLLAPHSHSTTPQLHTEPGSGSRCFQAPFHLLIGKYTNPKLPLGTLVTFALSCPVKPPRFPVREYWQDPKMQMGFLSAAKLHCAPLHSAYLKLILRAECPDQVSVLSPSCPVSPPQNSAVSLIPQCQWAAMTSFRPWQGESSCTQRNCSDILKEILRIKN